MAWATYCDEGLTVDVQFGDPVTLIVVGELNLGTGAALRDALQAASEWAGGTAIEVNLVFARFAYERGRADLLAAQQLAWRNGRRFTVAHELDTSNTDLRASPAPQASRSS
jgi:hypothetical protein